MKKKFIQYIKLMYFIVFGHLLLLLSALCEEGRTQFSLKLIPRPEQVPEMMEAIIASVTILVIWSYLFFRLEQSEKSK